MIKELSFHIRRIARRLELDLFLAKEKRVELEKELSSLLKKRDKAKETLEKLDDK